MFGEFCDCFELFAKQRNDLAIVLDDAEATVLEDGSVRVGVDGGDILRLRNAGHVLARAGDGNCEIQIRRDFLAGLTYLPGWRHPARVTGSARGCQLCAH